MLMRTTTDVRPARSASTGIDVQARTGSLKRPSQRALYVTEVFGTGVDVSQPPPAVVVTPAMEVSNVRGHTAPNTVTSSPATGRSMRPENACVGS